MSDIVITGQQIKEWQEERVKLEEAIQQHQAKLDLMGPALGSAPTVNSQFSWRAGVLGF